MTILTDSVLVESKSARSNQLAQIDEEQATEVSNKIKALYFTLWKRTSTAITEQVPQFYGVSEVLLKLLHWLKWSCFLGEKE